MFRVSIQNLETVQDQLADLIAASPASVAETANFVAQSTAQRAKHKISTGPRTGRVWKDGHQSSAPGEPPASDTGELVSRITFTKMTVREGSRATAGTTDPKGHTLEFGGHTRSSPEFGSRLVYIEPRPWLLPSFLEAINSARGKLKLNLEKRL